VTPRGPCQPRPFCDSVNAEVVPEDSRSPALGQVMRLLEAVAYIPRGVIRVALLLLLFSLHRCWELSLDFIYSCFLSFELPITAIRWPGGLPHFSLASFSFPSHMLCLPKSRNSGCLALKPFLFLFKFLFYQPRCHL